MRLHRYAINEAASSPSASVFSHMRRFLTIYRDDDRTLFSGHVETILRKPQPEFNFRFHVGTRGSETPFDGRLTILGSGIYWGIENGRKLADWLTRETKHKYDGRDLKLYVFNGTLYWKVWVHESRQERDEFAKWRDSSLNLNLYDHLYGPLKYSYENVATADIDIALPEGSYPITATLQKQILGRAGHPKKIESFTVDVAAHTGIPNRFDKSGGWKGDRVYGFHVPFKHVRNDWWIDAKAAITARILQDRANTGFRKAQAPEPVEATEAGE
ncbi:hypothetical protein [Rhodococcus erythropolis]|uniref:hypothetical protein n=1 Tax=Rhodococcus erythropolis TaxID=1833 RepID=UPI0008D2AE75|nr:hypothetical protein [Rhodococcus erythropolis]OFV78487.1 hypothetical protein RERY_09940 [Rhodococcus erythropolis]